MKLRGLLIGVGALGFVAAAWMVACVGDSGSTNASSDSGADGASATSDGSPSATDSGGATDSGASVDSGCGDTQASAANCGACGHQCSGTNQCFKGVCGNTVIQIAGSPSAADNCALLAEGTVWCWGDNGHGELGVGDVKSRDFASKIALDSTGAVFDHVVEIGMGFLHACARKGDGSIWCWGAGQDGATGVSVGAAQPDLLVPTRVGNLAGYKALRVGGDANCGIDGTDHVTCWGTNDHLVLGHVGGTAAGDTAVGSMCNGTGPGYANATPTQVPGISGVTKLAMGDQHACVVDSTTSVKCWGADDYNQLGDAPNDNGTTNATATSTPPCAKGVTTIPVPNSPVALGASRNQACALYGATSPAQCWGGNHNGELGIGVMDGGAPRAFGASVLGLAASGGSYHLCVLATDGTVSCAGANDHGALGSNAANPSFTPHNVLVGSTPISGVTALASGSNQSCALRSDGTVWCWGDNTVGAGGRLGAGDTLAHTGGAVMVSGLPQ